MNVPIFQKSAPLKAADLNALGDVVRRARILPGVGIKLTETLNGTIVSLKPTRSFGGGSGSEDYPWRVSTSAIVPEGGGDPTGYNCVIRPGSVNNILPVGHLDAAGIVQHQYDLDTVVHVVLTVTTDGQKVTNAEVALDTADIPPQEPVVFGLPTEVKILIAVLFNASVFQIVKKFLTMSGVESFRTDRQAPSPGELGYEAYYVWNVS